MHCSINKHYFHGRAESMVAKGAKTVAAVKILARACARHRRAGGGGKLVLN
jgi:hypothetical protein